MSTLSRHHFWEWFKRHHQEYLTLKTKSKKETTYWLNELDAHLRAYYKFFGFSLEALPGQKAILTITVDGKAVHFKKVDDLVAKAPAINGWTIVALEDPKPIDFFLGKEMEATGIDPREFYFSFPSDDPDESALMVYHPLCTRENENALYQLARDAVYNLLGERSFGTDIQSLDVINLSCAGSDHIEKLEMLPEIVGMRKSAVVIDSEGKLVIN